MPKQVIMQFVLETLTPIQRADITSFNFGHYCFIIEGKKILFDFEAYSVFTNQLKNGRLQFHYKNSRNVCFKNDFDVYSLNPNIPNDILTAQYLAATEKISIFNARFYDQTSCRDIPFKINSITFADEKNKKWLVSQSVLDHFNLTSHLSSLMEG